MVLQNWRGANGEGHLESKKALARRYDDRSNMVEADHSQGVNRHECLGLCLSVVSSSLLVLVFQLLSPSDPCPSLGPIGIDMLKIWRGRWREEYPVPPPSVSADDQSCTILRFYFQEVEKYQRTFCAKGREREGQSLKGKGGKIIQPSTTSQVTTVT